MYAIVILSEPATLRTSNDPEAEKWEALESSIRRILRQSACTQAFGRYVFLIPLESDLPTFAAIVDNCVNQGFPHKVLLLEHTPRWIVWEPTPAELATTTSSPPPPSF